MKYNQLKRFRKVKHKYRAGYIYEIVGYTKELVYLTRMNKENNLVRKTLATKSFIYNYKYVHI